MPRARTTSVTVSADGCTITLRHRLFLRQADAWNPNYAAMEADARQRIERTWQPPGGFRCGDCTVIFEFEFLAADDGALRDDVDGKHIFWNHGVSHQSGLGPQRRPGCWFADQGNTLREAAHEVGHELGMTDKYRFVRFDPAAPDDRSRWVEVDDPRGVGRGADRNHLPPDIRCVPKGSYPTNGLAFNQDGAPQQADLEEILLANGAQCHCRKPPPRGRGREAKREGGKARTAAAASRKDGGRRRIPAPWSNTDVPQPARDDNEIPDGPPRREPPARRAAQDRPLVFVPGMQGSLLVCNGMVVWPPDRANFVDQIRAMLDPALAKSASGLTPSVYEPLLKFIERPRPQKGLGRTRPETYEIFPYDWTSSCRAIGGELKAFIDAYLKRLNAQRKLDGKKPFETVDVIAHSFGALPTRIAKKLGAKIDRQAFLGAPHQGAPKSYFTLHPGIAYADSLGVLNNIFLKVLLWWHQDRLPDIPTREELLYRIAIVTESAWELLPDGRHITSQPPLSVDSANTTEWQHAYLGEPVLGSWAFPAVWDSIVADAMAVKDALGAEPQAPFSNIIATRHRTPWKVNYLETDARFETVAEARPGDSTVMEASSAAGGKEVVVRNKHVEIPSDKLAHDALRAFLG